jgi:Flp pilus assembly protein TadG
MMKHRANFQNRMQVRQRHKISSLWSNTSGLALIEFAYAMPIMFILASAGIETTNFVIVTRAVNDIAAQVSDNGARMGSKGPNVKRLVTEADINDVFTGAALTSASLDIQKNGRIILSSLEKNADGGQWIHWQRCTGKLAYSSTKGRENDGKTGNSFPGMGPAGNPLTATSNSAVMYAEVVYLYKPIVPIGLFQFATTLYKGERTITAFAGNFVRDDRDTTQIFPSTPAATASTCS